MFANGANGAENVAAVDFNPLAGQIAKRGMQDGAVFGDIDTFPREHRVATGFNARCTREIKQFIAHGIVESILRIIEEQAGGVYRKIYGPLGIGNEEIAHKFVIKTFGVLRERSPSSRPVLLRFRHISSLPFFYPR